MFFLKTLHGVLNTLQWQSCAVRNRLVSIFHSDLFQLIFMTDWKLPVFPKKEAGYRSARA